MITCIKDGYIVAFSPSGDNDAEYEEAKRIFNDHDEAKDGYVWLMTDEMKMVQIKIEDVPDSSAIVDRASE